MPGVLQLQDDCESAILPFPLSNMHQSAVHGATVLASNKQPSCSLRYNQVYLYHMASRGRTRKPPPTHTPSTILAAPPIIMIYPNPQPSRWRDKAWHNTNTQKNQLYARHARTASPSKARRTGMTTKEEMGPGVYRLLLDSVHNVVVEPKNAACPHGAMCWGAGRLFSLRSALRVYCGSRYYIPAR